VEFRLSLLGAVVAFAWGCGRSAPPSARDAGPGPSSPAISSGSAAVPPKPPLTRRGAALALSADETTLIVADEDHEALFLLPAGRGDTHGAKVVPLPGPPAEVVALGDRVLVTVRTLPTARSRAARDAIRGPVPTTTRLGPADEPWAAAVPSALAALEASEPPPKTSKDPAKLAASAQSRRHRAERIANEAYARKRPRNTPPRIFDPSAVRESQGGLLVVLKPDSTAGLVETGRVMLPPDAWGLAVTRDERRALVTSPWSARVTLVELATLRVLASVTTRREPRGIALTPNGDKAYVSHLVGNTLSVIELGAGSLAVTELPFPAAASRTPAGVTLEASLAYDLVLAPDAETLFVPRHALGAEGVGSWWGAATVDALDLTTGKPLAPAPRGRVSAKLAGEELRPPQSWEAVPGQAPAPRIELVQPRSVAYRSSTDTLLVASEGGNALTELDALAPDPTAAVVKVYPLASSYDVYGDFPDRGGGPAGVALSRDERFAYVYCRTTFDVARVELGPGTTTFVHLADDGLPVDASYGRRLFADARSPALSGGLCCASCHPEGRDDGYVWREASVGQGTSGAHFLGRRENAKPDAPGNGDPAPQLAIFARQTPMLAGRVRASGPFGWHAESPDLPKRLMLGTALHRAPWQETFIDPGSGEQLSKLDYLVDYLRSGLLPPPTLVRDLDATESRGKAIFESDEARCSRCHVPANEFTDRAATSMPLATRLGFDEELNRSFKTPSLWFIAGTAPYFHDGSQASLEDLVRNNHDRMGKTSHLDAGDQAALIAFLRTL